MIDSKSRQLLLSIAIISLMISATVIVQSANATALTGTIEKSITMNAGSDGRSFALVNGSWSLPSVEMVNHSGPFQIYSASYQFSSPTSTIPYSSSGITYGTPSTYYNPDIVSSVATNLGPLNRVPTFLIANSTHGIVSPTITLTCKDNVSLSVGAQSEIQVDATSPVLATIAFSSSAVGQLVSFAGLVTGDTIAAMAYDPTGLNVYTAPFNTGYFAFALEVPAPGTYGIYFTSPTSSYVTVTPSFLSPTGMNVGQFATGTMKIPETLSLDTLISGDQLPSQIVALSYSVNKGDQYALSFTADDLLTGAGGEPTHSSFSCEYFDVNTNAYGSITPYSIGVGGGLPYQPIVSEATKSGNVYVVLVANYISRFQYTMGMESATIPRAPLNTPWHLSLPTPTGMLSQLYQIIIPSESMVIMNYTNYSHPLGDPIGDDIFKVAPTGAIYDTGSNDLGTGYLHAGNAVDNYGSAIYMSAGEYWLNCYASAAGPSADLEINAYPIANITSGSSLSIGASATKAFAVTPSSAFHYNAFNVTMTSHLNASIFYRMTVYDNRNHWLSVYSTDGSTFDPGIGNKQSGASWLGTSGGFFTYDSDGGLYHFGGNQTTGIDQFVSTYSGRYFVILSVVNAYNNTPSGGSGTRWQYYGNLVATLKIDLYSPSTFSTYSEIRYVSLDSSSGTGSTSVTFADTSSNTRIIALALAPRMYTWTRITVSITNTTVSGAGNGTRGSAVYESIYDTLQYNANSFDYSNALSLLPGLTYCMVHGMNMIYNIEFGAYTPQMMIAFYTQCPASSSSAHTVVTITVNHFATPAVSGLTPMTGVTPSGPAAPFPTAILLVIVVVVVVVIALVIVFALIKRKK